MADFVGTKLGQYEIVEQVGRGGMATVYRAIQPSIGRDVAVKVLAPHLTAQPGFTERFYREVEIIAGLQHPHILPVHDFGEDGGTAYIVMAYLTGGTLSGLIDKGPIDLVPAVSMIKQIAAALDYAHKRSIIHRDFKPGNILLDAQGNAYLADFGLSKIVDAESQLTGTGILGTPAYMAPELGDPASLTNKVDIYALGIVLYEMLTGKLPYVTETALGQLMAHATKPVPDIRLERPDLPEGIQPILEKAMAKSPPERYGSATAISDDLDAVLGGSAEVEATNGLIFTDINARVIFVDGTFLKMTHRSASHARSLMGMPMHEVVGVEQSAVQNMVKEVSRIGNLRDVPMAIKDVTGQEIEVFFSATGTYDERGSCIGADFSMRYALGGGQRLSTPSSLFDTQEREQLYGYIAAQIDALRVLLIRTGGQKFGERLEAILNETAEKNGWSVRISSSQLELGDIAVRSDVYRGLISKAVTYACGVVGKGLVAKQMKAVDDQLGDRGRELALELGLKELIGKG
jgi:hypothetical protein